MKPRILQWTIVIVIALMAMVPFVACNHGPYEQSFEIWQSHDVSASGTVTFTYNGTVVGGPYNVHCPDPGYDSHYVFPVSERPDDISWSINITWWDGAQENWQGENQFWPKEHVKAHNTSSSYVKFSP